jgi:hypothetical protein
VIGIITTLKQSRAQGCQPLAPWTEHPTREQRHWHPDAGQRTEGISYTGSRWHGGRREQLLHLWAELGLDGAEQPFFGDDGRDPTIHLPIIQASDNNGEVGEINQCPDPIREQQLTGTHLAQFWVFEGWHGVSVGAFERLALSD